MSRLGLARRRRSAALTGGGVMPISLLVMMMVVLASPPAQAWVAGDLDATFSADGVATVGGASLEANGTALALMPGGAVVLAGRFRDTDDDPFAARWHGEGSPDMGFASGGGSVMRLTGDDDASFRDVTASGNQLTFAGSYEETAGDRDLYAVHTVNGTPDSGFGTGGVLISDQGGDDVANAVAMLGDGRIVVVGTSIQGSDRVGVVARFTTDGDPDATFSGDGVWTTPDAELNDIVVRPDGRILAVGSDHTDPGDVQAVVVQLGADGTPDAGWAGGGRAVFGTPANDELAAVALQPDGLAVVAGSLDFTSALLARLGTDGVVDAGYGVGGYRIDSYGSEATYSGLALDGAGRAVAVGMRAVPDSSDTAALVARFTPAGAPDPAFGTGGWRTLEHSSPLVSTNLSAANDVVLDPAGQIVVGGFRPGETQPAGTVWRLQGAPGSPPVVHRLMAIPTFDKKNLKAKKLKKIVGIASGDSLAAVQLAVTKKDKKLLRDHHKCLWATKPGNRFKKFPATKVGKKHLCTVPRKWLPVSGLTAWSVQLESRFDPGKYAFYARAANTAGQYGESSFVRITLTD